MAEKKDAAKAPKPVKETKKEAPKPEPAAAAAPESEKSESGNKKINKMTLAEIDAKLNEIKTSQGGLRSRYARQLAHRKKALTA
jgi:ribosomal protein L29